VLVAWLKDFRQNICFVKAMGARNVNVFARARRVHVRAGRLALDGGVRDELLRTRVVLRPVAG